MESTAIGTPDQRYPCCPPESSISANNKLSSAQSLSNAHLAFCCEEPDCLESNTPGTTSLCDSDQCPSTSFVGWDHQSCVGCQADGNGFGTTGLEGCNSWPAVDSFTECCTEDCFEVDRGQNGLGAISSSEWGKECRDCWELMPVPNEDGMDLSTIGSTATDSGSSVATPRNGEGTDVEFGEMLKGLDEKALQNILDCCCCGIDAQQLLALDPSQGSSSTYLPSPSYSPSLAPSTSASSHHTPLQNATPHMFPCKWASCNLIFSSKGGLVAHVNGDHLFQSEAPIYHQVGGIAAASSHQEITLGPQISRVHDPNHPHVNSPISVSHHNSQPHLHPHTAQTFSPISSSSMNSCEPHPHAHQPSDFNSKSLEIAHSHPHPHSHPQSHSSNHSHQPHPHPHPVNRHTAFKPIRHRHVHPYGVRPLKAIAAQKSAPTPTISPKDNMDSTPSLASTSSHRPPFSPQLSPTSHYSGPSTLHPPSAATCEESYPCAWRACPLSFPTTALLMSHLSVDHVGHGKASYRCLWEGCCSDAGAVEEEAEGGRVFVQRQKIMRHLQTHTGDRPFGCEICGKSFSEATTLTQHLRTHTDERPYPCTHPGCNKAFSLASALTIHFRTHTGSKPFHCPHPGCTSSFSESSNLSKHIRTHGGRKDYECDICGKEFGRSDQLGRHRKIHARKELEVRKEEEEGEEEEGEELRV